MTDQPDSPDPIVEALALVCGDSDGPPYRVLAERVPALVAELAAARDQIERLEGDVNDARLSHMKASKLLRAARDREAAVLAAFHVPQVAPMHGDRQWGVFCAACSRAEGDYVYPCRQSPPDAYWPTVAALSQSEPTKGA